MKKQDRAKKKSIKDLFYDMDYDENYEKVTEAVNWISGIESLVFAFIDKSTESPNGTPVGIQNHLNGEAINSVLVLETDTIKKILIKANTKVKWIDTKPFQRAYLLNVLAEEIENNANMISQIEIVCRGILGRDTRNKAVPLLAQYFYYYSTFGVKYYFEQPNWKPEGVVLGVISNDNFLPNLGLILAPALAAGYNVVLQVGTTLFPTVAYIVELAHKVGIPEGVIRLIPSDGGDLVPYLCNDNIVIVSLLVDLNNEKYTGSNGFNKKVINLSSLKIPVLVFDDADLDSAVMQIIDSAWGYKGLLPWSVNTILIQENIMDSFVAKLQDKLKSTKVGLGHDKSVDISTISDTSLEKLHKLIDSAHQQGVEVFKAVEGESYAPTLLIGGKIGTNKVLGTDEDQDANAVTVMAFRNIDEAVILANNSRQGLGASVWSENIGLVNEVVRKLKVNNVWVNSHGLVTPEITISPIKDSGVGYFGGIEGFYEYVQINRPASNDATVELNQKNETPSMNSAKKAHESWSKISKMNKAKVFYRFADFIQTNKKALSATIPKEFLKEWISQIFLCITESNRTYNITHLDFNLSLTREPLGVVAIENNVECESTNVKLIVAALLEGNAVVLLTNSPDTLKFYTDFSKRLPAGLLTISSYNTSNLYALSGYKELGAYFGQGNNPVYSLLPLRDSKIYKSVINDLTDIYRKVTYPKNVWSNIGKSSACTLGSD